MKYKQWNRAASAPQARAAMEAAGVPPLAALTLCARGLDTPEKASAFWTPAGASSWTRFS